MSSVSAPLLLFAQIKRLWTGSHPSKKGEKKTYASSHKWPDEEAICCWVSGVRSGTTERPILKSIGSAVELIPRFIFRSLFAQNIGVDWIYEWYGYWVARLIIEVLTSLDLAFLTPNCYFEIHSLDQTMPTIFSTKPSLNVLNFPAAYSVLFSVSDDENTTDTDCVMSVASVFAEEWCVRTHF